MNYTTLQRGWKNGGMGGGRRLLRVGDDHLVMVAAKYLHTTDAQTVTDASESKMAYTSSSPRPISLLKCPPPSSEVAHIIYKLCTAKHLPQYR